MPRRFRKPFPHPETPSLAKLTRTQIEDLMEKEKEHVFLGPEWLVAVKLESVHFKRAEHSWGTPVNSKKHLKRMGIRNIRRHDRLFYKIDPVEGWTREYTEDG